MKLTVSLYSAQRAGEAIADNRSLRGKVRQVYTNVWEVIDAYQQNAADAEEMFTELDETLEFAGIDPSEYSFSYDD